MKKRIITISRQCGSGGHTIASLLAQQLGVPLYDKKILKIVAQRSGLSEETVKQQGEYAPTSLLYSIAANISHGYNLTTKGNMVLPDQINAFQTEIIRELADKEEPCVIVGRCADYILRDYPDSFHVFIHGNIEDRKKRIVREHGIEEREAEKHIQDRDKKRSQHYKYYTDRVWGRGVNYNLCLDSSCLGIESCVDIIKYCIGGEEKYEFDSQKLYNKMEDKR